MLFLVCYRENRIFQKGNKCGTPTYPRYHIQLPAFKRTKPRQPESVIHRIACKTRGRSYTRHVQPAGGRRAVYVNRPISFSVKGTESVSIHESTGAHFSKIVSASLQSASPGQSNNFRNKLISLG